MTRPSKLERYLFYLSWLWASGLFIYIGGFSKSLIHGDFLYTILIGFLPHTILGIISMVVREETAVRRMNGTTIDF